MIKSLWDWEFSLPPRVEKALRRLFVFCFLFFVFQTGFGFICMNPFRENLRQDQSRGASPHTRPRRTARPILLGCSKTPLTELKAPWAFSVLMLSRQTLVPDSTDAISASMPRSRNERKCPAATPRGW